MCYSVFLRTTFSAAVFNKEEEEKHFSVIHRYSAPVKSVVFGVVVLGILSCVCMIEESIWVRRRRHVDVCMCLYIYRTAYFVGLISLRFYVRLY